MSRNTATTNVKSFTFFMARKKNTLQPKFGDSTTITPKVVHTESERNLTFTVTQAQLHNRDN